MHSLCMLALGKVKVLLISVAVKGVSELATASRIASERSAAEDFSLLPNAWSILFMW